MNQSMIGQSWFKSSCLFYPPPESFPPFSLSLTLSLSLSQKEEVQKTSLQN